MLKKISYGHTSAAKFANMAALNVSDTRLKPNRIGYDGAVVDRPLHHFSSPAFSNPSSLQVHSRFLQ